MRVLLIEDDRMIGEGLVKALTAEGFSVDWTRDGRDAETVIREPGYAVILLDVNLPGLDGVSLLKAARASGVETPILILTARDDLRDRIAGLGLGADDYLCKPFELRELQARIRVLIRRRSGHASAVIGAGLTELDTETHNLKSGGVAQVLPAREYALMLALMERPGRVLSRAEIEGRIYGWGEEIESGAVEYLIHSVRSKFGRSVILNVRGLGWMVAKP
jgi:two-component system OmpR family response regulator